MPQKLRPSYKFNEEQLEQLKLIVPEAFKDGMLDFNSLYDALSDFNEEESLDMDDNFYGLYWPGKRQAKRAANIPPKGTLVPVKGDGVDEENTKNIYIEGDNLEVLKLLQKSYAGKIKMIYIDPPYNTGNDFVYKDDFSQSSEEYEKETGERDEQGEKQVLKQNSRADGRFHSKWLSMMYPRLKLAHKLLSEDGIILINIDENEIVNLQIICDEIFGLNNNMGTIIWDKRNPKGSVNGISYQHEYIFLYTKDESYFFKKNSMMRPKKNAKLMINKAEQYFKKISISFSFEEANNEFKKWVNSYMDMSGGEKAYNSFDNDGNVFQSVSMAAPDKPETRSHRPLLHPITKKQCPVPAKGWRFTDMSMDEMLTKGEIIFGVDESTQPRRKYLLKDNMDEQIPSLLYYGGSDIELLSKLKIPFDTPKVVNIVKEHILSFTKRNDLILDFFSGSSTTAHAVMQLNAEDGGNRQFIMVQLQERCDEKSEAFKAGFKNICEIGKERIRRAGKKIKDEAGLTAANLDTGFKVYRCAPSNYKKWQNYKGTDIKEAEDLFAKYENPLIEQWKKEDLLIEIMLAEGFPLDSEVTSIKDFKKNKVIKISSNFCEHSLFICLDDSINSETINSLVLSVHDIFICLDNAVTDQDKARLDDKGLIKTI